MRSNFENNIPLRMAEEDARFENMVFVNPISMADKNGYAEINAA
jgi:hypothetical protein